MLQGNSCRRFRRRLFSLPPLQTVSYHRRGTKRGSVDAQQRLLRSRLHTEQTPLGVIEWNTDFEVTAWNPAAERIFGYSAGEALGKHACDLIVPPHITPHIMHEIWAKLLALRGGGERSTNENVTKNGATISCEWYNTPLVDARGKVFGVASLVLDITEQVAARQEREAALLALTQSEERFRLMTERASDLVSIVDATGVIRYHSQAVHYLLGYEPDALNNTTPLHLIHQDDVPKLQAAFGPGRIAPNGSSEPVVYRFLHKNGEWRWIESIGTNLLAHPGVNGLLINSRDITERVQATDELRWQTLHDGLTGLPNRAAFVAQTEKAIKSARRRKQKSALLFLDLDRFKWVNDTMGHDAGDALLREVAARLQTILPAHGLLARMSGDEFTLLLPGLVHVREVAQTARRVLHVLSSAPFHFGEREWSMGASVGIALFPRDGATVETLLKAADTAMYRAKEHAAEIQAASPVSPLAATPPPVAGNYQFFTPEMNTAATEQQQFDTALRRAVRGSGEFCLVFQPIVSADGSQKWQGVEALLRWRHPHLGLIGPDKFLHQIRESGLIEPLNLWVLREACRTSAWWRASGVVLPVWVNIASTGPLFGDTAAAVLLQQIELTLSEAGLLPDALVLEVTPPMVADVLAVGTLRSLRAFGVGLALDDFGTGYSSLAALRLLPLQYLKIDRALVQNMAQSPEESALVRAVADMAHALHFGVVAEGVENEAQHGLLCQMRCDLMQGYHIRRPLSAQAVADYAGQPLVPRPPPPPGPLPFHFARTGYNKENRAAPFAAAAPKES